MVVRSEVSLDDPASKGRYVLPLTRENVVAYSYNITRTVRSGKSTNQVSCYTGKALVIAAFPVALLTLGECSPMLSSLTGREGFADDLELVAKAVTRLRVRVLSRKRFTVVLLIRTSTHHCRPLVTAAQIFYRLSS